jgi:enolase-phosphatase E1
MLFCGQAPTLGPGKRREIGRREQSFDPAVIKAILTDIEGTTTSLAFVKDVLFPYSRAHLKDFLRAHANEPAVRAELEAARRLEANGHALDDAQLAEVLLRWIDEDRKLTPLKTLQGLIWEEGYRSGAFRGHVYEDAVRALQRWRAQGLKLYVFSSGSVQAQKLLFAHTAYGDLTPLFDGFFDTTVGAKKDPQAYRRIAAAVGLAPREMLFLSDIEAELDAASAAGLATVQLVRGPETKPAAGHPQARHFDEIDPARY